MGRVLFIWGGLRLGLGDWGDVIGVEGGSLE